MGNFKVAVFWSYFMQYGQMIINFGSSVILARLLSPTEIGIYSVSFVLIGFATLLRDFGVSDYLVQEKNLTTNTIQTAFTLNNVVAWCLAVLVYFLSAPIAHFYDQPAMAEVLRILAINLLLVPLGAVTFALLRKELKFKALAHIQLVAVFVTAFVSVVTAYNGASYLSMAYGAVAGSLTTVFICQFYRDRAVPVRFTMSAIRDIWSFSSHSVLFTMTRYTSNSMAEILTGKFLGMADVAILSKAKSFPALVSQTVTNGLKSTVLPSVSKIKEHPEKVSQHYLKLVTLTLGVVWPLIAFLAVMSEEVVLFLFGDQWVATAPIMKFTIIGLGIWLAVTYVDDVFKATGKIKLLSKLEPFFLVLNVAAVIIGSQHSIYMIVWLSTCNAAVRLIIYTYLINKYVNISWVNTCKTLLQNMLLALVVCCPVLLMKEIVVVDSAFLLLLISGSVFAISWLVMITVMRHPVYTLMKSLVERTGNA